MMGNIKKPVEIGILELQRHIPILYTFAQIFKTKNTKVTIFTTKEMYLRLRTYLKEEENFSIILKEDGESNRNFIKRVKKIWDKKIDVLFVNTIHETLLDLIGYLDFNNNFKKILLVHHVNAWLKPYIVDF